MQTYGFIAATEDRNTYHHQYFGILAYAVTHMLGRVEFVEEADYGLEDLENQRLGELVEKLVDGDVLIVSDIHRLGRSTNEIIGMFIEILKRGATVCAFDGQYDLGSNAMFRWLPCVLSILSLARKELELRRSKEPTNRKQAGGAVTLGRPVGSIGVSRLDGHEDEIVQLLGDGVSKAEIARRMSVSRPALHDFCVSRKLIQNG
jgi:DNA invertase Pin-like site-specific DNA recombinase